jgi:cyclohexa-1,5-dienecarbonyl-CoA hydratase
MAFEHLVAEQIDGITFLTLNRSPLNILNIAMMEEIGRALEVFGEERGLKLLVFRGAGKAFSAGVDIGEHQGEAAGRMIEAFHRIFRLLHGLKAPSLAAVDGPALGGGCELALFCDFVIATERTRFGQPEIQVGVFPPIAALILPALAGPKRAAELVLTGRSFSAGEAFQTGLVNKVVSDSISLEKEVRAWADRFRGLSAAVVGLARKALQTETGEDFDRRLQAVESIYAAELMATRDAAEGLSAFLEKRKPKWENR